MPNVALVPERATNIPALRLFVDSYPETKYRLSVETTEFPVEDGVLVQDHAVARAERLELRGWVSDQVGEGPVDHLRAARAGEELRRLHRETEIVSVTTEIGVFPEMVITNCEIEERGAGIEFKLSLGQVLRVGADTPGEITPDNAGAAVAERPSLVERGLVTEVPASAEFRGFGGAAARRLAIENYEPIDFSDFAQRPPQPLRVAAEKTFQDRLNDRLRDEVESRAAGYWEEVSSGSARAVLESQLADEILAIPGVDSASISSRLEGEGVRFKLSAVVASLGEQSASFFLRARDRE